MYNEEIIRKVLGRESSLFEDDIKNNHQTLKNNIKGKKILVIGGAGTIGKSFIKASLNFGPDTIIVIDSNENSLTELVRDLRSDKNLTVPNTFITYPVSFNSSTFQKIYKKYKYFDIIANFAAHKHVRSEKDIFSIEAMLYNNVIDAKDLIEKICENPPKHFFCVSTDKAANPVNIMGASKKLMEEMLLSYTEKIKITTARFANVAFSNGSLLDGFINRFELKQPITCPRDIKRYFVSQQESGEICLLACILGKTGDIFFPKLDPINDLIPFTSFLYPFLKLNGYYPLICISESEAKLMTKQISNGKYPVYLFNSDTTGEKAFEEFYTNSENVNNSLYQKLGVISKKPTYSIDEISKIIFDLKNVLSLENLKKENIVLALKKYIINFEHIEKGITLDSKM